MIHATVSWSPTIQVSARYYSHDNTVKKSKSVTLDMAQMRLKDNNLSASCGDLSIQFLSQSPLTYKLTYKAQGVLDLDVLFEAQDGGFQINDGKSLFQESDPSVGHVIARFIPRARISGTLSVHPESSSSSSSYFASSAPVAPPPEPIQGHGVLVSAIQYKPFMVGRWNFVNFHGIDEEVSILLYKVCKFSPDPEGLSSRPKGSFSLLRK